MFEIEVFLCIKMDLALITYNGAIKPNQTKLLPLLSLFNTLACISQCTCQTIQLSFMVLNTWPPTIILFLTYCQPSLRVPDILSIDSSRSDGFMPFLSALMLKEHKLFQPKLGLLITFPLGHQWSKAGISNYHDN